MFETSRKEGVDFPVMQNPDKSDQVVFDDKAQPVIADSNPIVPALGLELFEIGQLADRFSPFDLLDNLLDLLEKDLVFLVVAQILGETPGKQDPHAAP